MARVRNRVTDAGVVLNHAYRTCTLYDIHWQIFRSRLSFKDRDLVESALGQLHGYVMSAKNLDERCLRLQRTLRLVNALKLGVTSRRTGISLYPYVVEDAVDDFRALLRPEYNEVKHLMETMRWDWHMQRMAIKEKAVTDRAGMFRVAKTQYARARVAGPKVELRYFLMLLQEAIDDMEIDT